MGFIIFIFLFGAVVLFILIVGGILGLLFGGRDPYEEELDRRDREDFLYERDLQHRQNIDSRSVHLHHHEHRNS